jgi:hypothetical protein
MLQTLNIYFNSCYKSIILPFTVLALLLINVISDYATIRLFHEVKMPAFLGFPMASLGATLIVVDTFPTSYRMYEASEQLVAITKTYAVRNGYATMVLKSCRPLAVDVSYFFNIKRNTILTFLGIVIDYTINVLLNF